MPIKAIDVATRVKELASLPDVCIKINQLADDPKSTTYDIKEVIETDAALTARVLKIANSSFFNYGKKVDDLNRAIMLIGMEGLRDIVWATSSISSFAKLPNKFIDMNTFWRHSLYTATVARILAQKCRVINKDRIFLCGLLHDVGQLALYQIMPEEMEVVFVRSKANEEQLFVSEKYILGFTHATVSYALLRMWNLPVSICQAVAYHHQPGKCEDFRLDAAIIHIADAVAKQAGNVGHKLESEQYIDPNAWKVTGLSEKIVDSMIQVADEQFRDALALYLSPVNVAAA
ncbi:MAG: HDOD domain-containing protein [Gammaproteobacteria bacterium]|nr:HDOD domain-containing protein [Gammaproteobacteria bacterium]